MSSAPANASPGARERIENAAVDLFREHGLRGASADRIIARAEVSKVTFYRHFPSKDDLIVAYLQREWDDVRAIVAHAEQQRPAGLDDIGVMSAMLRTQICSPGFRGCPFINAAAELTDRDHPGGVLIRDYRRWLTDEFAARLRESGARDPDRAAREVMMLRDGAMVAGYLTDDADAVASDLDASIRRLIAAD